MLEELTQTAIAPHNPTISEWKEQGKKVIGYLCSYVPEEIIHATGILPYRVKANGCTKMTWGDVWMSNFSCSFARSCLEFAIDGTYDFLDGLVISNSCAQIDRLYDNWRFNARLPFMYALQVPHKSGDSAVAWYRENLNTFKRTLEEFYETKISTENLRHSIETCNETRALVQELYELRKGASPPITGSESHRLVLAATSMPKEQYNNLMKQSLEEIRARAPITDYRARIMLIGSSLEDSRLVDIIEDQGGLVVTDGLCTGSRYFSEPVQIESDLLHALAQSYLRRPNCPRMMDQHTSLFDFIREMVQTYNVDGIVYQKLQFCDLWGGESLFLEDRLKKSGIPFLSLQREHILSNTGQIATRVEAFMETIKGVEA